MSIHQLDQPSEAAMSFPESSVSRVGGGEVSVRYEPSNFKAQYVDEYTREVLPLDLVKSAMIEELNYFNAKVWEVEEAKRLVGVVQG